MVYLDNAATTQIRPEVLDEMMPYLTDAYGNPGGIYSIGRRAREAVDKARHQLACFLHCNDDNIVFTSCGSEGNNMIVRGVFNRMNREQQVDAIACSAMEHDSVINCVRDIGVRHVCLKPNEDGRITLNAIKDVDLNGVGLISVMYANNETGLTNDVFEIGKFCRLNGIPFHSDCVQAAGNYDLDINEMMVDFATISSHKIGGPKGVGAVFVRDRSVMPTLISGGGNQEFGLRGGTENVAGIVGFGKACEIAANNIEYAQKQYEYLKNKFICDLSNALGSDMVVLNGNAPKQSKTVNLWIKGVDAQSLIIGVGDHVCISAGSACNSREVTPSRVLTAMGVPSDRCSESIRVSFSTSNTERDIEIAVEHIERYIRTFCNGKT